VEAEEVEVGEVDKVGVYEEAEEVEVGEVDNVGVYEENGR